MTTVAAPGGVAVPINRPGRATGFAVAAFAAGVGLLLCSIANEMGRATSGSPQPLYWLGIVVMVAPIFYRLTSEVASPGERLALVCLLGLGLYGVKLVRDAPLFTFADEMIHVWNSNQISAHHTAFHSNPILPISRYYPGLEGATSALRSFTGLNAFAAGSIIVGAARLTMMSTMFMVFWRVGKSARAAGIGTAIFTGNFNFVFWSGQYSYESMALPLLMVLILVIVERDRLPAAARAGWPILAVILIAAIVVTHHITSYVTVATLLVFSLAMAWVPRKAKPPNPWPLALLAAVMTVAWLLVVASSTVGYLTPVLSNAFTASIHTIAGEAPTRGLFQGGVSTVEPTPLIARAVSLLAVVLLVVALPFGLRKVWRRFRDEPIAVVFAIAALGFFASLALRLAPAAWETGNRAGEFLFIGLAFVLSFVGLEAWRPRRLPALGRLLTAAALCVIVVGGAITGWPWDSQVAHPMRIDSQAGPAISSPPLGVAEWARQQIKGGRFAALTADSRLLLEPGRKYTVSDYTANVVEILPEPQLPSWALSVLRRNQVRCVVADQRAVASDGIRGYYFPAEGSATNALLPRSTVTKYEAGKGVARIFDGGPILVYDLEAFHDAATRGRAGGNR